jgi:hypothetical protein
VVRGRVSGPLLDMITGTRNLTVVVSDCGTALRSAEPQRPGGEDVLNFLHGQQAGRGRAPTGQFLSTRTRRVGIVLSVSGILLDTSTLTSGHPLTYPLVRFPTPSPARDVTHTHWARVGR